MAVGFVYYNLSRLSGSSTNVPKRAMGEVFPEIDPQFTVRAEEGKEDKELKDRKRHSLHEPVKAVEEGPRVQHTPEKKRERFSIKTKSDAKRAIIAAEIFNKKYC